VISTNPEVNIRGVSRKDGELIWHTVFLGDTVAVLHEKDAVRMFPGLCAKFLKSIMTI